MYKIIIIIIMYLSLSVNFAVHVFGNFGGTVQR